MAEIQLYLGVELQHAWRLYTIAVLDSNLKLIALRPGRLLDVLAYLAGQEHILAAVCGPAHPNLNRLRLEADQTGLFALGENNRGGDMRKVEYELLMHGLAAPRTPSTPTACPAWMRRGFKL